jgi:hypothetical protein
MLVISVNALTNPSKLQPILPHIKSQLNVAIVVNGEKRIVASKFIIDTVKIKIFVFVINNDLCFKITKINIPFEIIEIKNNIIEYTPKPLSI